jgi:hypothetical protein
VGKGHLHPVALDKKDLAKAESTKSSPHPMMDHRLWNIATGKTQAGSPQCKISILAVAKKSSIQGA